VRDSHLVWMPVDKFGAQREQPSTFVCGMHIPGQQRTRTAFGIRAFELFPAHYFFGGSSRMNAHETSAVWPLS